MLPGGIEMLELRFYDLAKFRVESSRLDIIQISEGKKCVHLKSFGFAPCGLFIITCIKWNFCIEYNAVHAAENKTVRILSRI